MTDDTDLSATYQNWSDRVTYIAGNSQFLVVAVLVTVGVAIHQFNLQLPGVPKWVTQLLIGGLVLYPPSVYFGVRVARWLRNRNYERVFAVNYVTREVEDWFVPPETWREKTVDGPHPRTVNNGDAYVVRNFEWSPEYGEHGQIRVETPQLSQVSDGKLYTSEQHVERMLDDLTDSHRQLTYLHEAIDSFVTDLQSEIVTRVAWARRQGEHLEPDAVRDVVDEFKDDLKEYSNDLSDISEEDVNRHEKPALPAGETTDPDASSSGVASKDGFQPEPGGRRAGRPSATSPGASAGGNQPAAPDGGREQ